MIQEKETPPEPPSPSLSLKKLSIAATMLVTWLIERSGDSAKDSTQSEHEMTRADEAPEQAT